MVRLTQEESKTSEELRGTRKTFSQHYSAREALSLHFVICEF